MSHLTQQEETATYYKPEEISGSEALIRTFVNEGVETVFGYPGGTIMPVYDSLLDHLGELKHILTRHEQGAIHAAQGYARTTGKTGVVLVTSGPGATNIVTGLADALADSTPLVCISGQVPSNLLGTDAFQEADIIGITLAVTKWSYRITDVNEIPFILSKAFYLANSGRPGPVMLDITKDAQNSKFSYYYEKCNSTRGYEVPSRPAIGEIKKAATLINGAKKPFLIFGQGVKIANANKELFDFLEKTGIPAGWTILGVSSLPTNHFLNMGMMGMHGNYVPNKMANECDLLIAVGMRFDDRITGNPKEFAKDANILHLDIDPSEVNKVMKTYHSLVGDVKTVLPLLNEFVTKGNHKSWIDSFNEDRMLEQEKVKSKDFNPPGDKLTMAEVVNQINQLTKGDAIITTDVGQHQMAVCRYAKISEKGNLITSGGIGTMGFGLPSAIGAKIGNPDKEVIAIVGDGGIQMTIQELGTIMQENLDVKIVILNNQFLGMVRQWQELFLDRRYSYTEMKNPDFPLVAGAYSIKGRRVDERSSLKPAIKEMLNHKGAFLLEVKVAEEGNVFPMIPSGKSLNEIIFEK